MSDVAKMKERIAEIDAIIGPLEVEKATLEQAVIESESPFKVGDVIEWRRGRQIARGNVVGICRYCLDLACWVVVPIRKDGTVGTAVKVYHYNAPRRVDV